MQGATGHHGALLTHADISAPTVRQAPKWTGGASRARSLTMVRSGAAIAVDIGKKMTRLLISGTAINLLRNTVRIELSAVIS